jgi:hypothetical protein
MRAAARRAQTRPRPAGSTRKRHKEDEMILATTTVEDVDKFVEIYSTTSAEKRKQHGSKGSTVFQDPNQADRVWAIFDWDLDGWQSFASDPEVPAIMREAGHTSKAEVLELVGRFDA